MTTMPHTPGPWEANGTYVRKILPSGYTLPITRVYNQRHGSPGVEPDMSLPEAEANARLIAAAPDLLAALEKLLHETDDGTQLCAREFAEAAHAAVAKAKGK